MAVRIIIWFCAGVLGCSRSERASTQESKGTNIGIDDAGVANPFTQDAGVVGALITPVPIDPTPIAPRERTRDRLGEILSQSDSIITFSGSPL
jgi:hypothetical protein